jgi:single-strand DNA-binding protein
MHQQITITGNLGNDPQLRYTPDGRPVANFSVATNRKWNDKDGNLRKETCWFRVADFRTAEPSNQYLQKGRQVQVVGRLRPDSETGGPRIFTRQDGTVGASYELIADRVIFLGVRGDNGSDGDDVTPVEGEVIEEDAIPF